MSGGLRSSKAVRRELRADADLNKGILRAVASTLTGRLSNLSQIAPEITASLTGGFAIASACWRSKGRTVHPTTVHLAPGGARANAWKLMLDTCSAALAAGSSVSLAPSASFAARQDERTLTMATDASGEDGFGGYCFLPSLPNHVLIVPVEWPTDVRAALANAARPRSERNSTDGTLSMPAAEAFAAVATCEAVLVQHAISAVYAISDCDPAVAALNAASSPKRQLSMIVGLSRRRVTQWLGVHVPWELNLDPDRLSHPTQLGLVIRDALAAGIHPVVLQPPRHIWATLRQTLHLPNDDPN